MTGVQTCALPILLIFFSEASIPVISTFGIGMKMFTPWALLRLDTAWDRYPNGDYSKPQYILSVGYDW